MKETVEQDIYCSNVNEKTMSQQNDALHQQTQELNKQLQNKNEAIEQHKDTEAQALMHKNTL